MGGRLSAQTQSIESEGDEPSLCLRRLRSFKRGISAGALTEKHIIASLLLPMLLGSEDPDREEIIAECLSPVRLFLTYDIHKWAHTDVWRWWCISAAAVSSATNGADY